MTPIPAKLLVNLVGPQNAVLSQLTSQSDKTSSYIDAKFVSVNRYPLVRCCSFFFLVLKVDTLK